MAGNQTRAKERRDATGRKALAPLFRFTDKNRLLRPSVLAPMRELFTQFLKLRTREKLLVQRISQGDTPTEAADEIAATVAEIEKLLAKPPAEREADLAAVAHEVETRLGQFAQIAAQIDPARRGYFTIHADGHATFTATDVATARSSSCQQAVQPSRKRGRAANLYNAGQIAITQLTGKKPVNRHISHGVQGCHSCGRGMGEWCIKCRRVSRDDIRIEKSPHNVRNELTETPVPGESGRDPAPATNLAPEIEDTLRRLLATYLGLSPLAILLTAHRATRNMDSFTQTLRRFVETMSVAEIDKASGTAHRYGRGTIRSAWNRMIAENPKWQVFRTWKQGHSRWDGAKKRKGSEAPNAAEIGNAEVVALESESEQPTDRSFDRRDPFDAERDDSTTRYFYPDDGTEL